MQISVRKGSEGPFKCVLMVFRIGGWIAVCGQRRILGSGRKWCREGHKTILPEDATGMDMPSALGGSPPDWLDLGGPKDVRGYAGCPLGGPD